MLRKLYLWTIHWSSSPKALPALFWISFIESSFFPIPPDFLLIPMVLGRPKLGMTIAFYCTLGSALGGGFGYFIGYQFWELVGRPLLELYGGGDRYEELRLLFNQYDVWIVAIAGFTPIPYKLFTITAGAMHSNFPVFMLVSFFARGARFFMVAGLLMWGGEPFRIWIEKYLDIITIVLGVMVVGAFVLVKIAL